MEKTSQIPFLLLIFLFITTAINAQEYGIFPAYNNVIYNGIDNPVKVFVEGYNCEDIRISSESDISEIEGCNYIIKPKRAGDLNINLSIKLNDSLISIGEIYFRVKNIPDPVITVNGKCPGPIKKEILVNSAGLKAVLKNFDYDARFYVISYSVSILKGKEIVFQKNYTDYKFSSELIENFRNAKIGYEIRFSDIKVLGTDKSEREMDPISFSIN